MPTSIVTSNRFKWSKLGRLRVKIGLKGRQARVGVSRLWRVGVTKSKGLCSSSESCETSCINSIVFNIIIVSMERTCERRRKFTTKIHANMFRTTVVHFCFGLVRTKMPLLIWCLQLWLRNAMADPEGMIYLEV